MVEARPFVHHEPGVDVDLLHHPVGDARVGGAAVGGQVAQHGEVGGHERGPLRREEEFVEVRTVTVAAAHVGEVRVGARVDHVFADPEAVNRDVALPPGEHRPAVELLHAQVRREGVARQRLEPEQPAGGVEDHRAGLPRPPVRRHEDVAFGHARGVGRDRHRRWAQVRSRAEALFLLGGAGMDRLRRRADGVGARDAEHVGDRAPGAADAGAGAHGDPLAFRERRGGQEARAVALRVGAQPAGMRPRAGTDDAEHGQVPDGYTEKADLRLRGCVARARQGRYCYGAGLQSRVVHARGDACGR